MRTLLAETFRPLAWSNSPNWTDVVDALKAGRIDAIYRDEFEIKLLLKSNPALNIKFGAAILTDQFAFSSIAISQFVFQATGIHQLSSDPNPRAFTLERLLSSESRPQRDNRPR